MLSRWSCHYLKGPLIVKFHKNFRLIFHRQPSCPKKCTEKCPKTNDVSFGNFLILLEQRFCGALVKICVLGFAIYLFPRQNKVLIQHLVNLVVLTFYFDLIPPLYFLKLNRYFAVFVPALTWLIDLLVTAGGMY